MKRDIIYITIALALSGTSGCVKTSGVGGSSAFNIVNAINNSNPIVTNFTPLNSKNLSLEPLQFYTTANAISWGSSSEGSCTGNTYLSIAQITDTTTTLWAGEFNLAVGSIHTLVFCGDTTSIDTLYTSDVIPSYLPTDSMSGVRFVNLVKNSQPMSVNIQGSLPSQMEFNGLFYKSVSGFKAYPANSAATGSYTFEIRDQASDSLLTVYYWNYTYERNNTIYIYGSGMLGINAFQMNNF